MRINTNLTAMNTYTQYTKNNNKIASSVAKLSSGYAINSAADNAAGLAISEKMRAQIRGLQKASTNSQDAISLVQTAEGALSSSTEILQRMREIAVQSANDTNENAVDRSALQDEFSQLQSELNEIAGTTTFNKKNLLDGSLSKKSQSLQDVALANSAMALSIGNAAAGNYSFNVSTKMETAAVDAKTGTTTAAMGTTASATFSAAATTAPTKQGALYNGNYTLSTKVNDDGTMTVNAKGDNGQNFTASITAATLDGLEAAAGDLALTFESSTGAADGFGVTLTTSAVVSTSKNGLEALASAIDDTTVSVDGGVDAQAATYGVYANMTGGESVKLNAGDKSVTFSNGLTVNFDELSATDVATTSTAVPGTAGDYDYAASGDLKAAFTATSGTLASVTATIDGAPYEATNIAIGTDGKLSVVAGGNTYSSTAALSDITITSSTSGTSTVTVTDGTTSFDVELEATLSASGTATIAVNTTGATATPGTETENTAAGDPSETVNLSAGIKSKMGVGTDTDATTATTFQVVDKANDGLTFQVGANEGDELVINIDKMNAEYLGVSSAKVTSQDAASHAITSVDSAINQVSSQRAYLGAIQNRLDYKISNLDTTAENLTSAESQVRDVDMAKEMTNFTNAQILSQAATAMLAQANSLPQNVLSLLG